MSALAARFLTENTNNTNCRSLYIKECCCGSVVPDVMCFLGVYSIC